jgi:hypothetical protein
MSTTCALTFKPVAGKAEREPSLLCLLQEDPDLYDTRLCYA